MQSIFYKTTVFSTLFILLTVLFERNIYKELTIKKSFGYAHFMDFFQSPAAALKLLSINFKPACALKKYFEKMGCLFRNRFRHSAEFPSYDIMILLNRQNDP